MRAPCVFWVMLALGTVALHAEPPPAEHRVLEQGGAPVEIVGYTANYQRGTSSRYSREGIRHSVTYRNISGRKIVALQFGLLSFNIFNEFQDRLGGYTIEDVAPEESATGEWLASALAESSFYTGVAYVSKVRFEDGQVWSADLDEVAKQVQELEEEFSVEKLKASLGS